MSGAVSGLAGFIRRNIVIVLALPILGVLHVGWYKLQSNQDFVDPSERRTKLFGLDLDKLAPQKKEGTENTKTE